LWNFAGPHRQFLLVRVIRQIQHSDTGVRSDSSRYVSSVQKSFSTD